MSATELLCRLLEINPQKLSREENMLLEAELFTRLCEELKGIFKNQYYNKDYFRLMKINLEKENEMLEVNLLCCIIRDIVATGEYTLAGIAYHTQIPEDVLSDIASGLNTSPSLPVSRKIIDLHRSVRSDLYREIMKKITAEHLIPVSV